MTDKHLNMEELERGLLEIRNSPLNGGRLLLISCRPSVEERELLQRGQLDVTEGLVGDNWRTRGSQMDPPRQPNPETQLTLMNARVADLVAGTQDRWSLAGDQLFADLNLGRENLPVGTRLALGSALIEVTAEPHKGCKKFVKRFGMDAMVFVNSEEGQKLCLRGINAKVVESGVIHVGDTLSIA